MKAVLLAGGTGGARLAVGMQGVLGQDLTVIANTGDDTEFQGLLVQPDLDAILYNLAGLIDPVRGWGRSQETFNALATLRELGEPGWFSVGDRDLGLHLLRRRLLDSGLSLTQVATELGRRLSITARVLPMSDHPMPTRVETRDGPVALQEWLVRDRCQPPALRVDCSSAPAQGLPAEIRAALGQADLAVIGPSNPFISILPIFSVPGLRQAWTESPARRVAIAPLVEGRALKGPLAEMMVSLGHEPTLLTLARLYAGLVEEWVVDRRDHAQLEELRAQGLSVTALDTVMEGVEGSARLALDLTRVGAQA